MQERQIKWFNLQDTMIITVNMHSKHDSFEQQKKNIDEEKYATKIKNVH